METWVKVLKKDISPKVITLVYPTKGKLVYEYNPFRNYRLSSNKYFFNGDYYTLYELSELYGIVPKFDSSLYVEEQNGVRTYYLEPSDQNRTEIEDLKLEIINIKDSAVNRANFEALLTEITLWNVPENATSPELYETGLLVDFITDELSFSLEHPIHIVPQYSYDGSVNLIINDGVNIPRLINSRFSATGKNTYEVINRKGNNDTNIYDEGDQFNVDTSLYKRVINIPKIKFLKSYPGGNLKVGNYYFYFKFADADGNETDFVGESGLVSLFIGANNPKAIHTGSSNENSLKQIKFSISNIDTSYDYVHVYYSRTTAELGNNSITEYNKIETNYLVNKSAECIILITGYEEVTPVAASDINLLYNIVDSVKTSVSCLNMLFLGNVHKPDIPYNELLQLSLRFLPYVKENYYKLDINENYYIKSSTYGYYDENFIYNNVGYWNKEYYRLGIVYIFPNNELSPVFNIRGRHNIKPISSQSVHNDGLYHNYPLKENGKLYLIEIEEDTGYIIRPDKGFATLNPSIYENAKGVISLNSDKDTNIIHSIEIRVDEETIQELKKYVKGYFFVRQTRIPTILALGVTIGIDNTSHTPTLPTAGGILSDILGSLDDTYVETSDITDVNYISEGFLTRFKFKLVNDKKAFWKRIGKTLLYSAAAFVAATTITFMVPGGALLGPLVLGLTVTGGTSVVGLAVGLTAAGSAIKRKNTSKALNGRYTEVPELMKREEVNDSRQLGHEFSDRIIIKDYNHNKIKGLLCPDYEINLPYFNQIFNGGDFIIRTTLSQSTNELNGYSTSYFTNFKNHFYLNSYYDRENYSTYLSKIIAVNDNIKFVGIEDHQFRSRAGEAEEVWRYEHISEDYETTHTKQTGEEDDDTKEYKRVNTDIIRGSFGPYLGVTDLPMIPCTTVDIMIPGYSDANISEYINIRMNDKSNFYAISDRIDINDLNEFLIAPKSHLNTIVSQDGYKYNLYRGDCYLCQFTHRLNRNFNDPTTPYNDDIVDEDSWKRYYNPEKTEDYGNINLGDVNAVRLGMWVTFKVRSSNNLNIRTVDGSIVSESAMTGHPRGYYPYHTMSTQGTFKHPDSFIYNKGFAKSVGDRWNFELPDVPHIKNWFGTRIMYSDIHINDAYKNGYRVFLGTHYRDYTRSYGEIVKLVELDSNLICVFEHGVALIPVNERAVASEGVGGNVYINTSNVLPENPLIISDMFGSQWAESILKTPGKSGDAKQYVYGVDTVAKKIWRTDGKSLLCISDFRVLEFLNNNITLGERELTPKIGIRNVKTVYNAFKRDVMFTFYDNTYGFEEKVWNLCWNELMEKFITFYSWVPSYMENINNIPFSFDRNISKWIAKLGVSHSESSFADGITLSNVIINDNVGNHVYKFKYIENNGSEKIVNGELTEKGFEISGITIHNFITNDLTKFIGFLSLSNRVVPNTAYDVEFELMRDLYLNHKIFTIKKIADWEIPNGGLYKGKLLSIYGLFFNEYNENSHRYVYEKVENSLREIYYHELGTFINIELAVPSYTSQELLSELYYRNSAGHAYADDEINKISGGIRDLPIFKDKTGKRLMLPKDELINPNHLVRLLNIRANIKMITEDTSTDLSDAYYNLLAGYEHNTQLIDAGQYESVVAVTPKWNLLFLTSDFWKHGQAGIIDITDDIYPTYWYGKQHPFEFEFIVINDPAVHKIFTNLEIISNKAKPESFHYEIVGETYDFAKDKVNMYFRQEALKALWLYNGADITYDRNFLKVQTKQLPKSADIIRTYYARLDTINEIEDYYINCTYPKNYDYRHLSGGEIVYYPNRQEYRIWNHVKAVDLNELSSDNPRSIIAANCLYLEDKWRVTINPLLVCYKNEYLLKSHPLILPSNSTWAKAYSSNGLLPLLPIYNSPIPSLVLEKGTIDFPKDKNNALYNLYDTSKYGINNNYKPLDLSNWLNDSSIYKYNFGEAQNRKETDIRGKFLKVRVRYSGEELAVINFLNTIYKVSYA